MAFSGFILLIIVERRLTFFIWCTDYFRTKSLWTQCKHFWPDSFSSISCTLFNYFCWAVRRLHWTHQGCSTPGSWDLPDLPPPSPPAQKGNTLHIIFIFNNLQFFSRYKKWYKEIHPSKLWPAPVRCGGKVRISRFKIHPYSECHCRVLWILIIKEFWASWRPLLLSMRITLVSIWEENEAS